MAIIINNSWNFLSMAQRTVEINIVERKLKVACPIGQESALLSAAQELTNRLSKAGASKTICTPEQKLLMTALNLANDLLKAQQQLKVEQQENQNKIALLQTTIEQAIAPKNIKIA
ncbi:cell division protein ZapA [Colwellia sp. TT2012]|uniref:cell division protein ZapA n=1 Tax=Colwellia sp. TT2012 TaxID=1720342 RepID=UPI001E357D28|nr:cell division protein ZapA [Colwellia sp. TT2012]